MHLIHDRGNFGNFGPGYSYGGWGLADDLLWALLLLGLLTLVVVLVVRLLRSPASSTPTPPATDRALEIARERFAKGEISPDEFEAIRKALGR